MSKRARRRRKIKAETRRERLWREIRKASALYAHNRGRAMGRYTGVWTAQLTVVSKGSGTITLLGNFGRLTLSRQEALLLKLRPTPSPEALSDALDGWQEEPVLPF